MELLRQGEGGSEKMIEITWNRKIKLKGIKNIGQ
jgi:hypothetical protein